MQSLNYVLAQLGFVDLIYSGYIQFYYLLIPRYIQFLTHITTGLYIYESAKGICVILDYQYPEIHQIEGTRYAFFNADPSISLFH